MNRCYISPERISGNQIELEREESHHLQHVLRAREGDTVELFDGKGRTLLANISSLQRHSVQLTPASDIIEHTPPPCRITLAQCIAKGSRMDWIIEKAVELGAAKVLPVISARTIVRISKKQMPERIARWQRIAVAAARQCGATWLTQIESPVSTEQLPSPKERELALVAALTPGSVPISSILRQPRPLAVTALIGPEGDLTEDEIKIVQEREYCPVSLGTLVLRTETAGLYTLSTLNCAWL